jgi:signal transduction histidine kinase/ActR/RegA family two-component response regulator
MGRPRTDLTISAASTDPEPEPYSGERPRHFVQFFEQEETLIRSLGDYMSAGLVAGDVCIVVGTGAHRDALRGRLLDAGHDVDLALDSGQLVLLDAAETLSGLLIRGYVDVARMRDRLGDILERARAAGRGVRIFGEMVALLWAAEQRETAVELEERWNELQAEHGFSLFCAYPFHELGGEEGLSALRQVCDSHSELLPPESFATIPSPSDRLRSIVQWRHKAQLLESEIAERRRAEESLRATKEELEQQVQDLRRLHELSVGLAGILDVTTVLREVLRGALAVSGTSIGLLSLTPDDADGRTDGLALRVHSGFDEDFLKESEWIPAGYGACGTCLARRQRVIVEDTDTDPIFADCRETARRGGFRACHSTPLVTRSRRIIGVLSVHFREPHRPSDRETRLMDLFAQAAADAIENARLHERSRRELDERHQLLLREQEARTESEKAGRLKDEFLATVSHELRTPLTSIIGWTHMLRHDKLDEAMTARALETIERASTAQAQLVEDMLDVSRMISGKVRLTVTPVDPAIVVQAACNAVQLAATSKDIRVSVTNGPPAPCGFHVLGDASRLQQVVWNLVANAVKFTPKGGHVDVRVHRDRDFTTIEVRDDGEGIDPAFLPHLFARFRQADGSSSRRHGGLGLGLAIVRHVVELHGGTVDASSEGIGRGSTFTVRLPMMPTAAEPALLPEIDVTAAEERRAVAESSPLRGVRVLVVDDDADTLAMLKAVLEDQAVAVTTAASVGEALQRLEDGEFDVLVSDLAMPGEDGYSLIRRLRAREGLSGRPLPAIALTAYVRVEDRRRALAAGFQMFVPKPIEPEELSSTIATLAQRS